MPIKEVDSLDMNSHMDQVKAAMSSCVATEVNNGRDQDQAVAMCNSMIKEKTGKDMMQPPKDQSGQV